jgi:hypothetical protein
MQASRAFIAMLVLVASAFAPALSTAIELEFVVPFISCDTANLFVVLVSPRKNADLNVCDAPPLVIPNKLLRRNSLFLVAS